MMKVFVLLFVVTSGILQAQSLRISCLENNLNGTCTSENLVVNRKSESIATVDNNGIELIDDFHVFNQRVKYLPTNIGEKFPHLTSLRIERSGLQNIDRGSFSRLSELETLSLLNNDLQSLDYDTFDDMPLLRHLDLNENNINELDRRIFNKLQALTTLNLGSNYLKSLDVMIFKNNRNLEHLSIQTNALKTLPITIFEKLEQLSILNLDNNELEGLPDQLFNTNLQLRELRVADNKIESVGAGNRERLMNLVSHNFLYNPCTKNLKQEATNEELMAILEENCKTEPPTRIKWLETEIEELRRSKRGDTQWIECAENEFLRNDENINSTRNAILSSISGLTPAASSSDISSIQDDLASTKKTLTTVDKKADDIKQVLTSDDSKVNRNFKTLKDHVTKENKQIDSKIDDKISKVKSKIDIKISEVITAIYKQTQGQDAMKTFLLSQIDTKLQAETKKVSEDVITKVAGVDTKIDDQNTKLDAIKNTMEQIDGKLAMLNTIDTAVKSIAEKVEKVPKCNFHELTFNFIESIDSSVDESEKFNTFSKILNGVKGNENKAIDSNFGVTFKGEDTFESLGATFKDQLKTNCGLTFIESTPSSE